MLTIERHNNKVYFEINNKMVTKINGKGWMTLQGEKFDRNIINNLVNSKSNVRLGEVVRLKSILNRHFQGEYSFK